MDYISTRGYNITASPSETIRSGIAPDGGLYVPESIPLLSQEDLLGLYNKKYQQIALYILEKFLTDFSEAELKACISKAYNSHTFGTPLICPLRSLTDSAMLLELWHGPTCAFKDLALQLLPHLLTSAVRKLGDTRTLVILVATSGDTGKAALDGFKNIPGIKVIVFYPQDGVSEIQKLQMITQEGNNVSVIGVNGNFDHAQSGVKAIFNDKAIAYRLNQYGFMLTSANSINWGRLLPQIVYYFSSYINLLKSSHIKFGDKINICVPTGNFGNIMAAYYAKKMGLPINKFIIATNGNNVLAKFLRTGTYDINRELKATISPSMDILISSNFERLLFELSGHNSDETANLMEQLRTSGSYKVSNTLLEKIKGEFFADYTSEGITLKMIKDTFNRYKYVIDPHTAVALHVYEKYTKRTGDLSKTVIASTASPYKFNRSVMKALVGDNSISPKSESDLLNLMSVTTKTLIPNQLKDLNAKPILHNTTCDKEDMKQIVNNILRV